MELKVEGNVYKKQSDREAVMQGRIYNKEGVLCTESKGIYALLDPKVAKKLNMMSAEALKDFDSILKA